MSARLDAGAVLDKMESAGNRLNLVILDACRNNPFGARGLRASDGGLAQMRAPEGTLISYATQPGSVAQDGSDGHSPYTRALAATIRLAGLDIFQTFNQVGLAVKRQTGGSQQPWVSSSPIDGTFYFVAPLAAASPQVAVAHHVGARVADVDQPQSVIGADHRHQGCPHAPQLGVARRLGMNAQVGRPHRVDQGLQPGWCPILE